ncbi:MAG: hypothetical protein ABGY75_11725, partial [Gemmataceae bacterium]
ERGGKATREGIAMSAQLVAVIALVGLAVAYIARATWKLWAGWSKGCGSGCGKCGPTEAAPAKGRVSLPQI